MKFTGIPSKDEHVPVMVPFVVALFSKFYSGRFADLTVGQGGHSYWILKSLKPSYLACVDRDAGALDYAKNRLSDYSSVTKYFHIKFSEINKINGSNIFDGILADLGMSNMQLMSDRGFSYKNNSPLDMKMDASQEKSLKSVLSESSLDKLCEILSLSGRRDGTKAIAKAVFENRDNIKTTQDLVEIVRKKGIRHDAAKRLSRVFQSFRIEVNDEIEELSGLLETIPQMLKPGARLIIISYHSVEDTIVKNKMIEWENKKIAKRFFKRVIKPSKEEKLKNKKSRSAHLRCAEFYS